MKALRKFCQVTVCFGLSEALLDIFCRIASRIHKIRARIRKYEIVDSWPYPVCIRLNTSDTAVLSQIIEDNEYSYLEDVKDVRLIIDCGGYTGLSSIWFLNKYKDSRIIILEPDPENFIICRKNLKFYGDRAQLLNMAVWSGRADLALLRGRSHWATRVREGETQNQDCVKAVGIDSLIERIGFEAIDILKIDIEGAEEELFTHNYEKWLPKIRNIAIELHDETCGNIFFNALSKYDYELFKQKDLTICKNMRPKK